MALGNWDTVAFNSQGERSSGFLVFGKSRVEFYKNWLYVLSNNMWWEGCDFVQPTIAEIQSGEITLANFRIYAERSDEQNSILAYVECGWRHEGTHLCMCGASGYGYSGDEWVGVEKPTLIELVSFLEDLDHVVHDDYVAKVKHFVDQY